MILIVDDFKDGAEVLCRLLGRRGYPCEWAASGREGLARIRSHPPEQPLLVVLDEMMPEMGGIDVLRQIRSDPRISHTTVMVYTAAFDEAKRNTAITLGVAAWLLKGGNQGMGVDQVLDTITGWYERAGGVRPVTADPSTAT
jgi:CheY-like chemotaxis protein